MGVYEPEVLQNESEAIIDGLQKQKEGRPYIFSCYFDEHMNISSPKINFPDFAGSFWFISVF